ncbi:PsbA protein [Actinomyces sp. zg296]|uniref:PsbA protein n=1 Tax=Actinomyces sp. zg296 TaxID=2609289 RepID=UPI001F1653DE|nr:PsbA protein [Actinomyces sp. zg296]
MAPPIGRDRRPASERGPVNWGQSRPSRGSGRRWRTTWSEAEIIDADEDLGPNAPGFAPRPAADDGPSEPNAPGAPGPSGPAPSGGPRDPRGTDWGVGRGRSTEPTPLQRARTPWPASLVRQRLAGIACALVGLVLATTSAMRLATAANAGHPWVPPWLVVVLGGAGLVSAAGYLAWAGGTPVRGEAERWEPSLVDAAAGLTNGDVNVADPQRLLTSGVENDPAGLASTGAGPRVAVGSGPRPLMGTSTVDQSSQAPAGVAGAVGGFMLAAAVVCAVIALVLGPAWLIGTCALAIGGILALKLAGDWLGRI